VVRAGPVGPILIAALSGRRERLAFDRGLLSPDNGEPADRSSGAGRTRFASVEENSMLP